VYVRKCTMVCGANAAVFVLCGSLVVSAEQAQDQIAGTSLFCGIFRVSLCADCIFPRSHSSITPLVQGCVLYIMLMQHDLQRCRAPATLRAVWLTRCAHVAQAQDVCRARRSGPGSITGSDILVVRQIASGHFTFCSWRNGRGNHAEPLACVRITQPARHDVVPGRAVPRSFGITWKKMDGA
jgi:hypothetical protein